jgi:hypothetical protein
MVNTEDSYMTLTIEYIKNLKKSGRIKPGNDVGLHWIDPPLKLVCLKDGTIRGHLLFKQGQTVCANQFYDETGFSYPNEVHLSIGYWWQPDAFEVKS